MNVRTDQKRWIVIGLLNKIRSSLFLDELLNVFMLYVIIGKPLVVLHASDRLFH